MCGGKFKHVEKKIHHLLSKKNYNRSHSSQHTQCPPLVITTHFRDQLHCQKWSNIKYPNKVIFIPNEVAAVGNCQKSIIAKAITSLVDTDVPFDQLTITNSSA